MAKPQATSLDHREAELFRGRGAELDLARGLWSVPLRPEQRRVLLVTGIGGIGKSALGRRIVRDLKDAHVSDSWLDIAKPAYAAIDLAEAWSQDVVQALLQVRLQLGMTWREARFPLFDVAFARIHAERFPSSDVLRQYELLNPDGALTRRLAPALPDAVANSERLQDAANGINEILDETPLIGTAYKYLNRIFAKGLQALDQRTEPLLQEIAGTSPGLLDQRLPECLGIDLRNAIRTSEQRRPVAVVIDTIEALHRSAPTKSGIGAFQNDAWLRELVWQARGVGFVLLGRDDVEWPAFEDSPVRGWGTIIETHRLGALSDPEVASILEAFPVPDDAVAAAIREGAEGLPFYLGLQLDIHRDLVDEGRRPAAEDFARTPKAVLARFASHLRERLATAFATLAHARRFDAALFQHLKEQPGTLIGPVGLPEITRYSLVEGDADGYFRLHQHYQDIQREELARSRPDDQQRIDAALFVYWDAACQPPDLRSIAQAHETALREAAHHQELLDAGAHVGWLESRWRPFFEGARLRLVEDVWGSALATAGRANGPKSAAMAGALGNLGNVLQTQGRLDEAREAQERALAIFEEVYGPDHHQVATFLGNLGNVYQMQGRLDDACDAQKRALAIKEKVYGRDDHEVAITLTNLGNVFSMQDRLDDARDAQERALAIKEKVYGRDHHEVAITLGNLGIVLRMQGRLGEASDAQERALAIKEKTYGPDHHEVAITLGNLGLLQKQLEDLPAALQVEERMLQIFKGALPANHPHIAKACEQCALTLDALGESERATELRARAAAIRAAGR